MAADEPERRDRREDERYSILGALGGDVMVFLPMAITEIGRGGVQVETPFAFQIDSLHELRLALGDRPIVVKGVHIVDDGRRAIDAGANAVVVSNHVVDLSWTDNSGNENGFAIERRRSGGSWSQVATVAAGVVKYRDTGRTRNITYVYRVRAFNVTTGKVSSYSNQVQLRVR